MGFSKLIRKLAQAPTVDDQLGQNQPAPVYAGPGIEDAEHLASYPRLDLGRLEKRSPVIAGSVGIYPDSQRGCISAYLPRNHMVFVGESGAGKTSALLRLIEQIARKTNWYVWVFDGKGDLDFARDVRAILYPWRGEVPIVQVGTGAYGAAVDGFIGDASSICNRLLKLAGIDQLEGNARHFANTHTLCLQALCGLLPGWQVPPPRSFAEVEEWLDPEWLKDTYAGYPKYHIIKKILTRTQYGVPYEEVGLELLPIINELSAVVRPEGHSIRERCMHFSLCVPNASEPAKRFFAFQVEVFKSEMIRMKAEGKHGIIIVDEHPAFENESVKGLLSMARSFGIGVVLSSQSTVSLGEVHIKNLLMANMATLVAMRMPYPGSEDIAKIAGTVDRPEYSIHLIEGQFGDEGSVRYQPAWNIQPGDIAQLPNGHAYILRQQKWIRVHFDRARIPTNVPPEPTYSPIIPATNQAAAPVEKPKVKKRS